MYFELNLTKNEDQPLFTRDDFSREKFSKSEFDTTKSALAVEQ